MRRLLQAIRFVRVALAARTIQDYLWEGSPAARRVDKTWDQWLDDLQKRVERLRVLDRSGRSWRVEARKRLLQLATLAVSLMEALDDAPNARFGPPVRSAPDRTPASTLAFRRGDYRSNMLDGSRPQG